MKVLPVAVVSIALLGLAGCGGGGSSSSADEDAIQAVADQYAKTAEAGDYKATCKLFTEESLKRIDDLKVFGTCEELMKTGLGSLSDEELQKLNDLSDLEIDGDTATATSRGGEIKFKKVDGEWKLDISQPGS